ncbi:MAG TPA: glycosyltransferase [Urbifossiella sp.]|jgi:glycosyltransferase involved in cell wall biosynthesis|nr:glycosyltransferase [Urbifossiella sp.]
MTTPAGDCARKRVLLISYPFPPVGGAGVQRVTKFVKYLPRHGWEVSVLTVANPSVPLYDDSLVHDIPPETVVRRARSLEPGYKLKASVAAGDAGPRAGGGGARKLVTGLLRRAGTFLLQPDPQVLWMPGAVAEGKRLLCRLRHDLILVSGPPFSSFLVGAALARAARLPLILDYRDEWTISNAYWENKRLDPVSRYAQGRMQRKVVRAAAGLLATTRSSAEALRALARSAGPRRPAVGWIYNGFDPDDFHADGPAERAAGGRFRLTYTGTLWNLTSVAPVVEAVRRLSVTHPDLAAGLEVVFAGRRVGAQADHVAALRGLPCTVVEHPYLDHAAAVRLMQGSQALLLLLSDLPGAGRVVPAKLFEYMAAARPMLAVAPQGETWDLLDGHPGGGRFLPADVDGIAGWLARAVRDHRAGTLPDPSGWDASAYTRGNEAAQLGAFLGSLLPSH